MSDWRLRRRRDDVPWPWRVAMAVLVAASLVLGWFALQRIGSLPALNYDEGWNAYRDRMAAEGVALYGAPPHLWITNYPFLSFHLVGLLGRAIGSMTVAGRIVSLVSLVAIGVLLAAIVRNLTGIWRGGVYAGLCFFVWVATFTPERVAMNDPDPLAAALAVFGWYAALRGRRGAGWLVVSAVAFAAAMFTKQDVVALPLGIGLLAVVKREWRIVSLWLGAGALAGFFLLLASYWLDGPYLIAHLFRPRAYRVSQAFHAGGFFLRRFAAPLGLGGLVLLQRDHRWLIGLLLLALVIAFGFAGGDGVGRNIFYIPLIVLAATVGVVLCSLERRLRPRRGFGAVTAGLLALPMVPGIAFTPGQIVADRTAQRSLPARTDAALQTIARLQHQRGAAICQNILLCYQAGKPIGPDLFFVHDQIATGTLSETGFLASLTGHRYAAIQLYSTRPGATARAAGHSRFFIAFMRKLGKSYRPLMIGPVNDVFVPRRVDR